MTDGDSDDQQNESTPYHAQANFCSPRTSTPPLLKLGLTNQDKEHKSNSWLSLNSYTPRRPTYRKSRNEEGFIGEAPFARNATSHPERSSSSPTPCSNKSALQKPSTEHLSLSPLANRTARKPRKQASHSNASLNIETTTENTKVDDNDDLG